MTFIRPRRPRYSVAFCAPRHCGHAVALLAGARQKNIQKGRRLEESELYIEHSLIAAPLRDRLRSRSNRVFAEAKTLFS